MGAHVLSEHCTAHIVFNGSSYDGDQDNSSYDSSSLCVEVRVDQVPKWLDFLESP
jgi:hypothetical protein